jgi:hypothetical protein
MLFVSAGQCSGESFARMKIENRLMPVKLPPGRAKLATTFASTGSALKTNRGLSGRNHRSGDRNAGNDATNRSSIH